LTGSVAIVGAGLVGRLLAWYRLEAGDHVTLYDCAGRTDRRSAGAVAAAMLAPYTEAATANAMVCEIGKVSLSLWPSIIRRLQRQSGHSIFFSREGTLVVSHAQDRAEWRNFNRMARERLGNSSFHVLNQDEIIALEPAIGDRFHQASYFPNEGVLCNDDLFACLDAVLHGDRFSWHENTTIHAVETLREEGDFDWIFDCRGMGAQSAFADLRGVRGEIIRVYAPEVEITRPIRLMHPRFPLYIAPRADHHYVIGATQIESEAMHPVTVRSGLELLSALYSVHRGFSEAQIIRMEAGCRPAFPNNLPRVEVRDNRISINGLFRHGYLFIPAILRDVQSFMEDKKSALSFPDLFNISD